MDVAYNKEILAVSTLSLCSHPLFSVTRSSKTTSTESRISLTPNKAQEIAQSTPRAAQMAHLMQLDLLKKVPHPESQPHSRSPNARTLTSNSVCTLTKQLAMGTHRGSHPPRRNKKLPDTPQETPRMPRVKDLRRPSPFNKCSNTNKNKPSSSNLRFQAARTVK